MASAPLRIGRYEVALLLDGSFEASTDVLTHSRGGAARQDAIEALGAPKIKIDVNCFALRDDNETTLIDAGTGEAWGPNYGHARAGMRDLGIEPDDVKRILLTHIHGDHALGLFEGEAAYFPRADVFVPEADYAFFTDPAAFEATPETRRGGFAIAERLKRIYGSRIQMIAAGPMLPNVEAILMPGHTPGHTGYLLRGEGDSLLIWADALHLGKLQPGDPDIGMIFDLDPDLAAQTRKAVLARAADEDLIVAGSHVTGFGRVQRTADAYQIIPI